MPAQTVIKLRRDTAANWTSVNPVLAAGEAGFESDTGKLKIGDGTTAWSSVSYVSGGASVEVSDTAPAEPEANTLWWESDTGTLFIYYDGFWVEAVAGVVGPQGETGATGATGDPGIVVQTDAPAETDILWLDSDDPADAVAVPAGGAAGQSLVKIDGTDYNTAWTTLSPNYIINGAFDVWQRGTSFAGLTQDVYLADRWFSRHGTAPTSRTVSQEAFTPADIEATGFGEASFYQRIAVTGTTSYLRMNQRIEDARTLAGQQVTVSLWARSSSATTVEAIFVQDLNGSTDTVTYGTPKPISSSWSRVSFTVTLPSLSGKTLGAENNILLILQSGAITDGTVDYWGVQLEAGSVATPFKRHAPDVGLEKLACQRYYWRFADDNNQGPAGFGYVRSSTTIRILIPTPIQMRVTPSLEGETNSDALNYGTTQNTTATYTALGVNGNGVTLEATISSTTQGQPVVAHIPNLELIAEL